MKLLTGLTILAIILNIIWLNQITAAIFTITALTATIYLTSKGITKWLTK